MAKKEKQRYRTKNSLEREEIIDKILEKTGTICQFCKETININEPVLLNSGKDNPRYPTFDHIIRFALVEQIPSTIFGSCTRVVIQFLVA